MKKSFYKKFLSTSLCLIFIFSLVLTGCSSNSKPISKTAASKNLPVQGDNLKYDPNTPVNDGKPITLTLWIQTEYKTYFDKFLSAYQSMHPNVKFKVTNSAYADLFKKLPIALAAGTGPDIFHVHNQFSNVLVPNMAPWPDAIFPMDQVKADFRQVDSHLINGKIYYIDYGMMTSEIFYNKDMWSAAGLTDNDIPKSWDQLRVVAKKLTKTDASGKITQAGFNYNSYSQYLMGAMSVSQGYFMFDKAGTKAIVNTPYMAANAKYIKDIYDVDKSGSIKLQNCNESMGNGQSAMVFGWGWMNSYFKNSFPKIKFGVFANPTMDGNPGIAYDRQNGESTLGISAKAKPASQKVGFDFLKSILTNNDFLTDIAVGFDIAPSKFSLDKRPEIINDPILAIESQVLDRTFWPGPAPDQYYTGMQKYVADPYFINKVPIDQALSKGEAQINKDMAPTGFVSVERQYKNAADMKN